MHRLKAALLACALGLGACVVTPQGTRPQAVAGEPDTFRFRIFPSAVVLKDTFADRAADEEIATFRQANGYASSAIVSRSPVNNEVVYTVRFSR